LAENVSFAVLIDKIRPAIFAVDNDKERREWKAHKVTRRYLSTICGADTPRPIPIKILLAWSTSRRNKNVPFLQ